MKRLIGITGVLHSILLLLAIATCGTVRADAGNFWYGIYAVGETGVWGDTIWNVMSESFHMNWALIGVDSKANGDPGRDSADGTDEVNACYEVVGALRHVQWRVPRFGRSAWMRGAPTLLQQHQLPRLLVVVGL